MEKKEIVFHPNNMLNGKMKNEKCELWKINNFHMTMGWAEGCSWVVRRGTSFCNKLLPVVLRLTLTSAIASWNVDDLKIACFSARPSSVVATQVQLKLFFSIYCLFHRFDSTENIILYNFPITFTLFSNLF